MLIKSDYKTILRPLLGHLDRVFARDDSVNVVTLVPAPQYPESLGARAGLSQGPDIGANVVLLTMLIIAGAASPVVRQGRDTVIADVAVGTRVLGAAGGSFVLARVTTRVRVYGSGSR